MGGKAKTKAQKGVVGFVYGGFLKQSCTRFFWCDTEDDFDEYKQSLYDNYGTTAKIKCAYTTTPEDDFDKFVDKQSAHRNGETHLFQISSSTASSELKVCADVKRLKSFSYSSGEDDSEDQDEKKTSKTTKKTNKSKSSKKATKKEESEDEDEDEDEDEGEPSDNEQSDGSDGEESEDEKPPAKKASTKKAPAKKAPAKKAPAKKKK